MLKKGNGDLTMHLKNISTEDIEGSNSDSNNINKEEFIKKVMSPEYFNDPTLLHEACIKGDVNRVKSIYNRLGVSKFIELIKIRNTLNHTALEIAIASFRIDVIKFMVELIGKENISEFIQFKYQSIARCNILHYICKASREDIFDILLEILGKDKFVDLLSSRDPNGNTIFHYYCSSKNLTHNLEVIINCTKLNNKDLLRLLSTKNHDNKTPLELCNQDSIDMIIKLCGERVLNRSNSFCDKENIKRQSGGNESKGRGL